MKKRHDLIFRLIKGFAAFLLLVIVSSGLMVTPLMAEGSSVRPPEGAASEMFNSTLSRDWQSIKKGAPGTVSIADKKAAILIQSGGQDWREFRLGTLFVGSGWVIAGMIVLLGLFFLLTNNGSHGMY